MGSLTANDMATTSTAVSTVSPQPREEPAEAVAVLTLRQAKTESRKKVVWAEDTVDNENMNKKKSKCCCIYTKPRKFGESDSEDSDDECEQCFGHVEKRKQKTAQRTDEGTSTQQVESTSEHLEAPVAITLKPEDEDRAVNKDTPDS